MIYYFSGTGNSKYVATTLANLLSSECKFIPATNCDHENPDEKDIVFVFPVYSWGVPPIVLNFIKRLPENFWERIALNQNCVHAVMTCGDEVALAPEMFLKAFKNLPVKIKSIWSIQMPNNYVLLPGFDVDPKDLEKKKLKEAPSLIMEVFEGIFQGIAGIHVVRGNLCALKTKLIYPLFKRWGINPSKWKYKATCIGCGKCAAVCPVKNIHLEQKHPKWGSNCCSCLGCFHICPVNAVEYSHSTEKKGQYFFPLKY